FRTLYTSSRATTRVVPINKKAGPRACPWLLTETEVRLYGWYRGYSGEIAGYPGGVVFEAQLHAIFDELEALPVYVDVALVVFSLIGLDTGFRHNLSGI